MWWEDRKRYGFRFALALWLAPKLYAALVRLIRATNRVVLINKEFEDDLLKTGGPLLYATWHQPILYELYHFRHRNILMMSSPSKDGEIITRILEKFGYQPVRGSSGTGGSKALAEMLDLVQSGRSGGVAIDASRGPARVAKHGIVVMAAKTGTPILPVATWASRKLLFKSWDRMLLPLPFGKIVICFGESLCLPRDAEREVIEDYRVRLQERLNELTEKAKAIAEKK